MQARGFHVIPASWLERRLTPEEEEFDRARSQFGSLVQPSDEIWTYDEPAPPGVNAGELGVALVRSGTPIRAIITGIH
jgi:hypothetical protein